MLFRSQWRPSLHIYSEKLQEDEGGKRWKNHTDRVFPSSTCESLDRKDTDRVFSSSACELLDQKHTDRVFLYSACEPLDQKYTDRVFLSSTCELLDQRLYYRFVLPTGTKGAHLTNDTHLIKRLTSTRRKHTSDPTAHKRSKETHDPCASSRDFHRFPPSSSRHFSLYMWLGRHCHITSKLVSATSSLSYGFHRTHSNLP